MRKKIFIIILSVLIVSLSITFYVFYRNKSTGSISEITVNKVNVLDNRYESIIKGTDNIIKFSEEKLKDNQYKFNGIYKDNKVTLSLIGTKASIIELNYKNNKENFIEDINYLFINIFKDYDSVNKWIKNNYKKNNTISTSSFEGKSITLSITNDNNIELYINLLNTYTYKNILKNNNRFISNENIIPNEKPFCSVKSRDGITSFKLVGNSNDVSEIYFESKDKLKSGIEDFLYISKNIFKDYESVVNWLKNNINNNIEKVFEHKLVKITTNQNNIVIYINLYN